MNATSPALVRPAPSCLVLFCLLLMGLAGCGLFGSDVPAGPRDTAGGGGGDTGGGGGGDWDPAIPAEAPPRETTTPTCDGAAEALLEEGHVSVDIPPGALDPCVQATPALELVAGGAHLAGAEVDVSPAGQAAALDLGTAEPIQPAPDEAGDSDVWIELAYDDDAIDPAKEDALHVYVSAYDPGLDQAVPLHGEVVADENLVWVTATGLPPRTVFSVVYNPAMDSVASDDPAAGDAAGDGAFDRRAGALTASDWPADHWCVAYDASRAELRAVVAGILGGEEAALTADQIRGVMARRVAGPARAVSAEYQALGFRAPYLYANPSEAASRVCPGTDAPVYLAHVVYEGGSFFRGSDAAEAVDVDSLAGIGDKFGRLYIDVDRLDDGPDTPLGTVKASIAHELFHGIHAGYELYVSNHRVRSITEGTATTVGRTFDGDGDRTSVPLVRSYPDETFPVSTWLLAVAENGGTWRYRAADFFAYVSRRFNANRFDWLPSLFAAIRNRVRALPAAERRSPPWPVLYAALDEGIRTGIAPGLDLGGVYFEFACDRLVEHSPAAQFGRAGEVTQPGVLWAALLQTDSGLLPPLEGDPDALAATRTSNRMTAYSTRAFRVVPTQASREADGVGLVVDVTPDQDLALGTGLRVKHYRGGAAVGVAEDDGRIEITGWGRTTDDVVIVVVSNTSDANDQTFTYEARTEKAPPPGECTYPFVDDEGFAEPPSIETAADLERLRGCDRIANVTIADSADITSLGALAALREVRWELSIQRNAALVDLGGLANLRSVGTYVAIRDNERLASAALPSLTGCGDDFSVMGNPALASLRVPALTGARALFLEENGALASVQLDALATIDRIVSLEDLPALGTLTLPALTSIGGSETALSLVRCPALTTLTLSALAEARGQIGVFDNASLATFSLPALATTIAQLSVWENDALATLALPALPGTTNQLVVRDNPSLSGFDFAALSQVGGDFRFTGNPSLPTSAIEALRDQVQAAGGIGGSVLVAGNGEGK